MPNRIPVVPRALLVGGVALVLAAPLAAQRQSPAWDHAVRTLEQYAATDGTVGAALVLVANGTIAAEHYRGHADRAAGIPADRGTIWHWGSITKTLTAVAVMQQRERGRVALDDPATRWIPELRRIHNGYGTMDDVTVRMLLSHTSGLQSGTWPWTRGEAWEPFEPTRWEQLVAMMPYMRLGFQPGTAFRYSNPALLYLARIVEEVTGDPWQGYVGKNLFAPLALHESSFGSTPYHLAARRSHGYTVMRNGTGNVVRDHGADFDPGITIPNGGWNAPVTDLARWAAFLAGSADPAVQARYDAVLPRRTLEAMWQPVVAASDEEQMGLSFFLRGTGETLLVGHTGTQGGFRSFLWVHPASRRAIIGVVNTSNEAAPDASREGFEAVMTAARAVIGG